MLKNVCIQIFIFNDVDVIYIRHLTSDLWREVPDTLYCAVIQFSKSNVQYDEKSLKR